MRGFLEIQNVGSDELCLDFIADNKRIVRVEGSPEVVTTLMTAWWTEHGTAFLRKHCPRQFRIEGEG